MSGRSRRVHGVSMGGSIVSSRVQVLAPLTLGDFCNRVCLDVRRVLSGQVAGGSRTRIWTRRITFCRICCLIQIYPYPLYEMSRCHSVGLVCMIGTCI